MLAKISKGDATTFFCYGGTYICLLVPGNASLQNLLYEAEAFCHLVDVVIQSIHQAENESYPLIVSWFHGGYVSFHRGEGNSLAFYGSADR